MSVKTFESVSPPMYDAVLFDNDGVLVELTDIETIYAAVEETFGEFGVEPSREDVRELVGVSADDLARVCRKHGLDADEFWRLRDANVSRVQRESVDAGEKAPYADFNAVERIARDHAVGVVSNNQQATVDHIVERFGMSFFEVRYGREPTVESLRRKKPSPFYVERALDTLGADADETLYVGDSPSDVTAADRAGVDSAFVRREHRRDAVFEAEPTYKVDSLHGVEKVIDGRASD
ncbi:MAG: HAD-IA family hydrolase [Halobacteriales archaeon]|nr:HAD-IA family hydrolase [Halobacteriales archaeon]